MVACSNQKPGAATVQWSSIQTNLEEADSDVLILLDCCAAASSAGGSGNGITEVIAACGFEDYAPGVGEHSFTRSLIEELRYYGQRPGPISTAFLHNKVLARAKKSWNPRYATGGTQERRKTPIHIHLADRSKQRCIELTPLPHSPELRDLLSRSLSNTQSLTQSTSPSEDIGTSNPTGSSQTSLSEVWPDPEHNSPKVLISVALEEDQFLRTEDLLDWLRSFPALAKCVRIESVYKSDSTLLLLSLPVAIWDMVPNDPAISFVAFVKSHNLLNPRNPERKTKERKIAKEKELEEEENRKLNQVAAVRWYEGNPGMVKDAERNRKGFGSPSSQILYATSRDKKIARPTESTRTVNPSKPTYVKVHRKHLSPDTLDEYDLPWEYDDVSPYSRQSVAANIWCNLILTKSTAQSRLHHHQALDRRI